MITWNRKDLVGIEGLDPAEMWRPLVSTLDIVEVDGTHPTAMLPPLVRGLAAEITARLRTSRGDRFHNRDDALRVDTNTGTRGPAVAREPFASRVDAESAMSGK